MNIDVTDATLGNGRQSSRSAMAVPKTTHPGGHPDGPSPVTRRPSRETRSCRYSSRARRCGLPSSAVRTRVSKLTHDPGTSSRWHRSSRTSPSCSRRTRTPTASSSRTRIPSSTIYAVWGPASAYPTTAFTCSRPLHVPRWTRPVASAASAVSCGSSGRGPRRRGTCTSQLQ